MAKPQQPELRRSGMVPDLDPDATETVLSAQDEPKTSRARKKVPEEQQPGHHPDEEQDKPDMEKFAERLGIVSEDDEPDDAPRVEEEPPRPTRTTSKTTKAAKGKAGKAKDKVKEKAKTGPKRSTPAAERLAETFDEVEDTGSERRRPPVKLLLLGPAVTYVGVRAVYRRVVRIIRS